MFTGKGTTTGLERGMEYLPREGGGDPEVPLHTIVKIKEQI